MLTASVVLTSPLNQSARLRSNRALSAATEVISLSGPRCSFPKQNIADSRNTERGITVEQAAPDSRRFSSLACKHAAASAAMKRPDPCNPSPRDQKSRWRCALDDSGSPLAGLVLASLAAVTACASRHLLVLLKRSGCYTG